jgi:hypothetical protein
MAQPIALESRALYTLSALALAGNVPKDKLRRLLRASGVRTIRAGRVLLVPLAQIREKIPGLWESIVLVERLRAGGGAARAKGKVPGTCA